MAARRWLDLGFRVQPSDFLKPVFVEPEEVTAERASLGLRLAVSLGVMYSSEPGSPSASPGTTEKPCCSRSSL